MLQIYTTLKVITATLVTLNIAFSADGSDRELKEIHGDKIVTNYPVYEDADGNLYSRRITVKFNERVTEYDILEARQTEFSFLSDDFENVQTAIQELIMEFELNAIEKTYPFEQWGDNIRRNRRTGEMVETSELSQVFYLYFQRPVSIQKVTSRLNQIPKVDYAEGPGIYFLISDTTPNDPENTDNWAFEAIELQKAWDLARIHQSDYITIAVSDFFIR